MGKENLTRNILIALFLGFLVGIVFNLFFMDYAFVENVIVNGVFELTGNIFLNAIKMMVVPIVFFSLVTGTSSMSDVSKIGRVGGRTLAFYLMTTAIAVLISISLALVINPGNGFEMSESSASAIEEYTPPEASNMVETLSDIVPSNIVNAMADGEMLQIIFFAVVLGIALAKFKDKSENLTKVISQANDISLEMIMMVMYFAPIGVFALISKTFATEGLELIIPLSKYFFGVLLALLIQGTIVYAIILKLFTGLSIRQFFRNSMKVVYFAFSSSSSSATIPLSLDVMENNHGVDREISAFTIPLGATINMDGTSIMQGVAFVFIAQISGVPITIGMILTVVIMATLASIGTAGVPGVGLVMLAMVLQQVGLDPEYIGLIVGVDRLIDMARTSVNVLGDQLCTIVVAKSEGAFNEEVYNAEIVD